MPEPDPTLLEIEEPVSPFWRVWESGQLVIGVVFLVGLLIWGYRQYNGEVMAGLTWVETAVSALITWLSNAPFFSNILLLSLLSGFCSGSSTKSAAKKKGQQIFLLAFVS
jgi:hypothetical protein